MLAAPAAWLERLAEMRDVALEHVHRRLWRRVAPDLIDQPVGRDDLIRVQEEQRENSPLLRAAERERSPIRSDLERAQDVEFELFRDSNVTPMSPRFKRRIGFGRGAGRSRPSRTSCRSMLGRRAREREDPQVAGRPCSSRWISGYARPSAGTKTLQSPLVKSG